MGKVKNDAYHFWRRVDEIRGTRELRDIATSSDVNYKSILVQRSNSSYPKAEDLVAIAKTLESSVEYLVTGDENACKLLSNIISAPKRTLEAIEKLLVSTADDVTLVRRVLGLSKDDEREKTLA